MIAIILLLVPLAGATPVIVEEVNERKATVYVPVGVEIKPGDQLFSEQPKVEEKVITAPENSLPPLLEKSLRRRVHILSVEYGASDTELKMKAPVNVTSRSDTRELSITYAHNTGFLMPWVSGASSYSRNGEVEGSGASFGVGLALNFIQNKPGNDLIPYASIGIGLHNQKYSDPDLSLEASGSWGQGSAGIMWFPFSELAAVLFSWKSTSANLDVTGGSAPAASGELEISTFQIGYALAF